LSKNSKPGTQLVSGMAEGGQFFFFAALDRGGIFNMAQ